MSACRCPAPTPACPTCAACTACAACTCSPPPLTAPVLPARAPHHPVASSARPAKRRRDAYLTPPLPTVPSLATSPVHRASPPVRPPAPDPFGSSHAPPSGPPCRPGPTVVSSNAHSLVHPDAAAARDALRAVCSVLRIDPALLAALPPSALNPASPAALAVMRSCVAALATLVCPNDATSLAARFAAGPAAGGGALGGQAARPPPAHARLADNVVAAMRATRRGTLARRYVRSVLCGTMSRADVNELLGYAPDLTERDGSAVTSASKLGSPTAGATSHPSGTSGGGGGDEGDEEEDGDEENGGVDGKLPRMSSKTFSRSRRDWDTLLEFGELQPAKFGRSRVQDEALRQLLRFLFAPENVVLVSWTKHCIVANGKRLELPAVVGAKKAGLLHEAYCKMLQGSGNKPLSRGSFYTVANTLTRRQVNRAQPIDDMTQTLVMDPLTLLRDFVMRLISYPHRSSYLRQIDKLEWFLRHSFVESHVGQDADGYHDMSHALQSDSLISDVRAMYDRPVACNGCAFPLSLVREIQAVSQLDAAHADHKVLNGCLARFESYLGLMCRKATQDQAIETVAEEIVVRKLRKRVLVFSHLLSYAEAVETGKEHLVPGIDGVSMHGSAVFFLGKQSNAAASFAELDCLFYNYLVCNDTRSDVGIIAVVMEALLHRIKADLPHVEEIIFVSDNGPEYKNDIIPSLLPHLARTFGLHVVRYIYSCSQVAESLINAEFEVVMGLVQDSLRLGGFVTPEHVVRVMNNDKNRLKVAAEVVVLGPEHEQFAEYLRADRAAFPSIGNKNDVVYQEWKPDADCGTEAASVIARLYSFYAIGKGRPFVIKDTFMDTLRQHARGYDPQRREVSAKIEWIGSVTGVKVAMVPRDLSDYVNSSHLSRIPLPNGMSGGIVADAITRLHSMKDGNVPSEKGVSVESANCLQGTHSSSGRVCPNCRRGFKSESFLKSHTCKGPPMEKDVAARAISVACEMLHEGTLPIFRDPSEQLSSQHCSISLWFGWAMHAIPEAFGESSRTLQYKREVFATLEKDSSGRVDAIETFNNMRLRYAGRQDFPSQSRVAYWCDLYEATKRIQPFYMVGSDGIPSLSYDDEPQVGGSGRARMNPRYTAKLSQMHKQHLDLEEPKRPKPRYMFKEFESFFRDAQGKLPPDFPDQKQVMNKINAMRTKSKQQ